MKNKLYILSFAVVLTGIGVLSLMPPSSGIELGEHDKWNHFIAYLVLSLNWFIRSRQGDEYVYLEQVNDPPEGLPDRARSAIFREAPESQGIQPGLAAIEGALELNDLSEATTLLFELPSDQLEHPGVLALRITLSRRKGHNAKANELLELLRVKSPRHPLCEEQTPLDPPPGG